VLKEAYKEEAEAVVFVFFRFIIRYTCLIQSRYLILSPLERQMSAPLSPLVHCIRNTCLGRNYVHWICDHFQNLRKCFDYYWTVKCQCQRHHRNFGCRLLYIYHVARCRRSILWVILIAVLSCPLYLLIFVHPFHPRSSWLVWNSCHAGTKPSVLLCFCFALWGETQQRTLFVATHY